MRTDMKLNALLFGAYLKCPTKCFLRSRAEVKTGNFFADWLQRQNDLYRKNGTKRLLLTGNLGKHVSSPLVAGKLKRRGWGFTTKFTVSGKDCETIIHAVERQSLKQNSAFTSLIPIRFVFTNKLNRIDKLQLAFDAFVLSEMVGHEVKIGKIIHGDNFSVSRINFSLLAEGLQKIIDEAVALVSGKTSPDLILNPHCPSCEFQSRCRQKAVDKDDLSLLSTMTEKERKRLNNKGIFTVSQLSFTFRPRKRPKRQRNRHEKHHNSLKALAIRNEKIHIVGDPHLMIEGTPVYLDVEGLPDRDFYYLIGVRAKIDGTIVQRSFWANEKDAEKQIWHEFLGMLEEVENPILIHYGSFETTFIRRMSARHGAPLEGSKAEEAVKSALNINSFIYAQVYFPTYSNSLKDIGAWLGYKWSASVSSGLHTIIWREKWKLSNDPSIKQDLVNYNLEDCQALEVLTEKLLQICSVEQRSNEDAKANLEIAHAPHSTSRNDLWRPFASPIADFETINKAARWDYQRDRVYVRTDKRVKNPKLKKSVLAKRPVHINKQVDCTDIEVCPNCEKLPEKVFRWRYRILYDVRFTKFGLQRWIVKFHFRYYWCAKCDRRFGTPEAFWPNSIYGRNLVTLIVYEVIELCIPQQTVKCKLNRLFDLRLATSMVHDLKASAASYYADARESILNKIVKGELVHADETPIKLKDREGYVWVFATFQEVVYFYSDTREGDLLHERLKGFDGVLISDFYSAYESLACEQHKCLLHLLRDLNEAVLHHPYDEDLKQIATGFAELLRGIVETIDRWGLKRRFLRKHLARVDKFYRQLLKAIYHTDAAEKWKTRFQKNRDSLFTFLAFDGIPWNNNNAEHAIKAFARLRKIIGGITSPKGIDDYLILLSVCQTCKYSGIDFLDFLQSGEKTMDAFVVSKKSRAKNQN
jgi:predicted RecB family nuclease